MAPEFQRGDFWIGPRRELRSWFERNAPSLGELYEGALKMLFMGNFPGRTRFVAHAVREIRNRLPDVIAGVKTGGTVQYKNNLDMISKDWQKAGFLLDGTIPTSIITEPAFPPEKAGRWFKDNFLMLGSEFRLFSELPYSFFRPLQFRPSSN
jgi:hypothetical protein